MLGACKKRSTIWEGEKYMRASCMKTFGRLGRDGGRSGYLVMSLEVSWKLDKVRKFGLRDRSFSNFDSFINITPEGEVA